jgi:hypothetical protein
MIRQNSAHGKKKIGILMPHFDNYARFFAEGTGFFALSPPADLDGCGAGSARHIVSPLRCYNKDE